MTHPACGECKHSEMRENDQGKLYLSAIFSSGYKYADFFRWHDCSAVVTIPRSQDLKMAGVRERVVFLVSEIFFPHRYMQGLDRSSDFALHHAVLRHFRKPKKVFLQRLVSPTQLMRNTGVQDGRKCVGSPLPCYWMVVSTDMLFLQDPLGSCKGNDSVIWSSSSFLEPCDSPHGHQRILIIISQQQFPFGHVLVQMSLNYTPVTIALITPRKIVLGKVQTWLSSRK